LFFQQSASIKDCANAMIAQPAVMAAPWRDNAGDLLDVRYSGLGNIAHRAGKGALIIRVNTSDPHW
ncbi:MAG: hypothetical protein WB019_22640, partial [Pseudolabrys sp.]